MRMVAWDLIFLSHTIIAYYTSYIQLCRKVILWLNKVGKDFGIVEFQRRVIRIQL